MKELTKKVIILNNFSSPYVSQAIIVLKDYNPKLDGKAIADAEMVVSKYIERIEKTGQPAGAVRKKGKFVKIALGIILIAVMCVVIRQIC